MRAQEKFAMVFYMEHKNSGISNGIAPAISRTRAFFKAATHVTISCTKSLHIIPKQRMLTRLGDVSNAQGTGSSEHHDVQQRVGAQPVRSVHGGTGRLARCEQALHHLQTNSR